jgi:hypothetical protein
MKKSVIDDDGSQHETAENISFLKCDKDEICREQQNTWCIQKSYELDCLLVSKTV